MALHSATRAGARCCVSSEGIPGRALSKFKVADVDSKTRADAGADRDNDDAPRIERGEPETADKIGRSIDAGKAVIDRPDRRKVVDQHHRTVAVSARVEAQRRPLPEDGLVARVARIYP